MPAARHRSRSLFIACAVMATMRTCWPVTRSRSANRDGRVESAHDRHLQIHQHEVEGLAIEPRQGLTAVLGDRHVMAAAGQQAGGDPLVDHVVLDEQDAGAPAVGAHGQGAGRRFRGRRQRPTTASTPIARSIAASRSAAYTGLVRYAAMPSSAQRAWSPYSPDELSIMTVAPASSGRFATSAATSNPSMSGMFASSRTSSNGRCGLRGRRERLDGGASARDHGRRHPPASDLLGENAPVDLVVVDDQHVEVRRAGIGRLRPRARR